MCVFRPFKTFKFSCFFYLFFKEIECGGRRIDYKKRDGDVHRVKRKNVSPKNCSTFDFISPVLTLSPMDQYQSSDWLIFFALSSSSLSLDFIFSFSFSSQMIAYRSEQCWGGYKKLDFFPDNFETHSLVENFRDREFGEIIKIEPASRREITSSWRSESSPATVGRESESWKSSLLIKSKFRL